VKGGDSPLTRGLGASFVVEDEPYFIELQDPASTRIVLTADYGPGATSTAIGPLYSKDTSLQPDGTTRVLGYTRQSDREASPTSPWATVTTRRSGGAHAGSDDTTPLTFPRLVVRATRS